MDISRMADISSISRTTLTHSAEHRTQEKSSTLAADHTDAFIKSEAAFTPAYTKRSARSSRATIISPSAKTARTKSAR
ncbi:MAG: hypothetical protein ACLSG5_08705 [Oscillospiraceae bacterium]